MDVNVLVLKKMYWVNFLYKMKDKTSLLLFTQQRCYGMM